MNFDRLKQLAGVKSVISEDSPRRGPSWKAGGFPFVFKDRNLFVCLVTSTDPAYGGPDPAIPKGHADIGERPEQTAKREVYEETKIPVSSLNNAIHISSETITGLTRSYEFHVYGFQLDDIIEPKPTEEAIGKWYPIDEALRVIRKSHKGLLLKFIEKVRGR